MKFDDRFVDQVRDSVNIVDFINDYVRLKKSGRDHGALCPFHNEKTPSFWVSESKQIFKCFGCGAGGDVFKFAMLIENLSFPESIRFVAERSGIPLPKESPRSETANRDRAQLVETMQAAADFFSDCLRQHPQSGEARDYLKKREIEETTIETFGIGYAPPGSQLMQFLVKKGHPLERISACGLLREGEQGQHYDKFRNRVMFRIRDLRGQTIAFGGRVLGDGMPKYLNSPETALYHKGRTLYGLDRSRDSIRRRDFVILVEGYFDCIVPFQFGFKNVVASLGTSLTQDQVRLLARYTRNVIINFDPDSAGMSAALRSIDLFLEQGFRVNVVQLPGGLDPDTFLRTEGAAAYEQKLKQSVPYLEYALERFMQQQADPHSPKGKQETVSSILPYLLKVPNRIERAEYVSKIAARLRIDEKLILGEMRRVSRKGASGGDPAPLVAAVEISPAEVNLLNALLDEEFCDLVLSELDIDLIEGLPTQKVLGGVLALRKRNQAITIANLERVLTEKADADLLESVTVRSSQFPLSEEVINGSVEALRRKQYDRVSRQIQEEIRREEQQNRRSTRLAELVVKKEQLRKKLDLGLV